MVGQVGLEEPVRVAPRSYSVAGSLVLDEALLVSS